MHLVTMYYFKFQQHIITVVYMLVGHAHKRRLHLAGVPLVMVYFIKSPKSGKWTLYPLRY